MDSKIRTQNEFGTTGRYLVLLDEGEVSGGIGILGNAAGLRVATSSDFVGGVVDTDHIESGSAVLLEDLGVAVVDAFPDQLSALGAKVSESPAALTIEAERVVYAFENRAGDDTTLPRDEGRTRPVTFVEYIRGYRDGVSDMVRRIEAQVGPYQEVRTSIAGDDEFTWGIRAVRAAGCQHSGMGVRIAILDTGLDFQHPDFLMRSVQSESFVSGATADDQNGHGTHCVGTACAVTRPDVRPRYGVASDAELWVGKVLDNTGHGPDGGILAGMQWAVANNCAIVSMSLGASTRRGQTHSQVFDVAARRARTRGTIVLAAAGNDSYRPWNVKPIAHPANCPAILAVGAVDVQLRIAPFSNGSQASGGSVAFVAPGVDVWSAWPAPELYRTKHGTSMATPHAAGVAALWAETDVALRGDALASRLSQSCLRLGSSSPEIGAGLVQAP